MFFYICGMNGSAGASIPKRKADAMQSMAVRTWRVLRIERRGS